MSINETNRSIIVDMIHKYVPNKTDNVLHINPYLEMEYLIMHLIEENVLPLNRKAIELICKEWKTLLYKKYAQLN